MAIVSKTFVTTINVYNTLLMISYVIYVLTAYIRMVYVRLSVAEITKIMPRAVLTQLNASGLPMILTSVQTIVSQGPASILKQNQNVSRRLHVNGTVDAQLLDAVNFLAKLHVLQIIDVNGQIQNTAQDTVNLQ
jgi:hypothetical protein